MIQLGQSSALWMEKMGVRTGKEVESISSPVTLWIDANVCRVPAVCLGSI